MAWYKKISDFFPKILHVRESTYWLIINQKECFILRAAFENKQIQRETATKLSNTGVDHQYIKMSWLHWNHILKII
jgi:hypothetical protein